MFITEVESIIKKLTINDDWGVYSLKYKHSKRHGTTYQTKQIRFHVHNDLVEHIKAIQDEYCNKRLPKYEKIQKYDGTYNASIMYYFDVKDSMISDKLEILNESIANPITSVNINDEENAFVIQGTVEDENGTDQLIKLITLRKPFTTLKNKFYYENGEYVKMDSKLLNLPILFDILIIGNERVYFMNFNAENLFDLERTYKKMCKKYVDDVCKLEIISDKELFSQIANSGHNPRKFISFNSDKMYFLNNKEQRENISKTFNIALESNGRIDTSDKDNINRLVKFLCDRAVLDPTSLQARESDGTRAWR